MSEHDEDLRAVALAYIQQREEGVTNYTGDPDDIVRDFSRTVDFFLDAGPLFEEPSTVIDLTGDYPKIVRQGSGSTDWLEV